MPECGNPNYRDWIKEEMDNARLNSSKAYFTYKKAYDSICKNPMPFNHPIEAKRLEGVGDGIVKMLLDRQKKYCRENGLPLPQLPKKRSFTAADLDLDPVDTQPEGSTRKRKTATKPYIPKYRTGGYGIMLALLDFEMVGRRDVTKDQISRVAQEHCDASYTRPEAGSSYTAFASMNALCKHGYVWKNGRPAKFQLTESGLDLARQLKQHNDIIKANGGRLPASMLNPSSSSGAAFAAAVGQGKTGNSSTSSDMEPLVNPSTARGRARRKRIRENQGYLDWDQIDSDEPESSGLTSSSMNDIELALSTPSSSTSRGGASRQRKGKGKQRASTTASILDNLLESMGGVQNLSAPDMSQYVLDPSKYQSITVNGKTSTNRVSTPARGLPSAPARAFSSSLASSSSSASASPSPSSSSFASSSSNRNAPLSSLLSSTNSRKHSSVTLRSTCALAREIMNASSSDEDEYDFGFLDSRPRTPIGKTSTPKKPKFNVDDYSLDLESQPLPAFKPSQGINGSSVEVVDLLSSPEASPVIKPTAKSDDFVLPDDDDDFFPLSQSRNQQIADETFHFTYLDVQGNPQRHAAKAAVEIDTNNGELTYLIKYFSKQAKHPKAKNVIRPRADGDYITGYVGESHVEAVCTGLPATPVLPLHREEEDRFWPKNNKSSLSRNPISSSQISLGSSSASINNSQKSFGNSQKSFGNSQTSIGNGQKSKGNSQISIDNSQLSLDDEDDFLFVSNHNRTSSNKSYLSNSSRKTSQLSSDTRDLTSRALFPSQQQEQEDYEAIIAGEPMPPIRDYEIVLVLDSREIQMKTNRDYFQQSLARKGVKCVTRSMDLGDVIWVARPVGSTDPSDELFLDYVVERKRLDDLVSSIKDGRFTEQKTRLKRSGARKIMYVIEEYNRQEAERFGAQAIQTAMSSTQISDGIFLKRTKTVDETIDYLVSVTNLIKTIYQDTTLYMIPGNIITRKNYLDLKEAYKKRAGDKEAHLINYPMYGQLNVKNGSTSVHEVYLRMLMTIRGVNAEKALSLMKAYPTPHSLLKAFERKSVEEAKSLAKNATASQISRRRWGKQLSEKLYTIWGATVYPETAEDEDMLY